MLIEIDWGGKFNYTSCGYPESHPTGHKTSEIEWGGHERITSTTPGPEPPRDARDSGSARSHSMHLETSSSDRP